MSGDFALVWSAQGSADLAIASGDFVADEGLRTALEISLFIDRRADDNDVLPGGVTGYRGWWGDAVADVPGDRIGSRLWLLAREKNSADTLARAEEYAREALAWLLTDKVAERVDVTAEFLPGDAPGASPALGLTVNVVRPTGRATSFRFGRAWEAEGAI